MPERSSPDEIRDILRSVHTIAVLGASPKVHRAGHYVPRYLAGAGYTVVPVNPEAAGDTLFGREVVASLADIDVPVDAVDVFRRPEHLPDHLPEILALDPLPAVVWLQQGVRHRAFAEALVEAGIDVVQDRCMLADHQRLL
jgi:predicted CoA-binding protein